MSVMGVMHLSLPFCLLLSELNEQRHLVISSDPAATAATTEMENPTQAGISASPQSLSECPSGLLQVDGFLNPQTLGVSLSLSLKLSKNLSTTP
ncbi:hypothetical protein PGTUg99_015945 [Puccinia graminis f. sp. tritici]|uniref:Uncharacterized protein n=1 Tax=Puccinia graminis f. sp. tritici TaxID=56615 RepID=A0A5B0NCN4_PUCGR|nr:hypothetical protein PGTUg99_015945 [Puccinia graminis f. sp. tritici]